MTGYHILLSFFIYSFLGWCAEVAFAAVVQKRFVNRGFLNGPLCPIYGLGVTVVVILLEPFADQIVLLYGLSALLVTILEGITGYLLEKIFHHKWWDYSHIPFNIKGYVCVPFSLIWGVACVLIVKLIHPLVYKFLGFIPVWAQGTLTVLLGGLLMADIYTTVTGIFKLNQRLEKMKEIAEELHHLSDQIGENIYQNMMEGIEMQEKSKKRAEELRQKYAELLDSHNRLSRRILRAFPAIKSKHHGEQIAELRAYLKRKHSEEKETRKAKKRRVDRIG